MQLLNIKKEKDKREAELESKRRRQKYWKNFRKTLDNRSRRLNHNDKFY